MTGPYGTEIENNNPIPKASAEQRGSNSRTRFIAAAAAGIALLGGITALGGSESEPVQATQTATDTENSTPNESTGSGAEAAQTVEIDPANWENYEVFPGCAESKLEIAATLPKYEIFTFVGVNEQDQPMIRLFESQGASQQPMEIMSPLLLPTTEMSTDEKVVSFGTVFLASTGKNNSTNNNSINSLRDLLLGPERTGTSLGLVNIKVDVEKFKSPDSLFPAIWEGDFVPGQETVFRMILDGTDIDTGNYTERGVEFTTTVADPAQSVFDNFSRMPDDTSDLIVCSNSEAALESTLSVHQLKTEYFEY